MAINPSISLQVRQPEFPSALDTYGKVMGIRQAQQQQQLGAEQLKEQQLQNQQHELDAQDQAKSLQAYQTANGHPEETIDAAIKLGVRPKTIQAMQQHFADYAAKIAKTKADDLPSMKYRDEKILGLHDQAIDMATKDPQAYAVNYPQLYAAAVQLDPEAAKHLDPNTPPTVDQLKLSRLGYATHTYFTGLEDEKRKQATEKRAEALRAEQAAQHAAQLPGLQAKSVTEQAQLAGQLLGAAKNQQDWEAALAKLPAEVRAQHPAEFTPEAAQRAASAAMTAEQRATQAGQEQDRTQRGKPNTAAELALIASDPSKPQADRDVATAALKVLERHAAASRPVTNVFNPPAGTSQDQGPVTLDKVPEKFRGQVQAITEYRSPMPAMGRNNPFSQELSFWVNKVNPTYDGTQFAARNKTQGAFASGKEAASITSFNTAIGHLGSLYDAAEKLGNADFRGYNTFSNWLSKQSGKDTVKPFELAHIAVSEELAKALKGGVAAQGEVARWEKAINDADSPQQLRTAIRTITELLASRINALEDQYKDAMGRPPSSPFIREKSRKVLEKIGGGAGGGAIDLKQFERR